MSLKVAAANGEGAGVDDDEEDADVLVFFFVAFVVVVFGGTTGESSSGKSTGAAMGASTSTTAASELEEMEGEGTSFSCCGGSWDRCLSVTLLSLLSGFDKGRKMPTSLTSSWSESLLDVLLLEGVDGGFAMVNTSNFDEMK